MSHVTLMNESCHTCDMTRVNCVTGRQAGRDVSVHEFFCIYVRMYVHICKIMDISVYIYICIYLYVDLYMYTYTYTNVCMYIYTYIHCVSK